jgi:NAD-dependent DNA ligase
MSEENFQDAATLEAWLKGRGVDDDDVGDAAFKLFASKFNKPSRLLGITIQELKEYAEIEGPVARELSNKLKDQQNSK